MFWKPPEMKKSDKFYALKGITGKSKIKPSDLPVKPLPVKPKYNFFSEIRVKLETPTTPS